MLNQLRQHITGVPTPTAAGATHPLADPLWRYAPRHVNIVTLQPGYVIPFTETHVMEHGSMRQPRAVYWLNQDRVEVEAGDYAGKARSLPTSLQVALRDHSATVLQHVNRHMLLNR
jgi:(S)-ureidoglycine aminohydrolase